MITDYFKPGSTKRLRDNDLLSPSPSKKAATVDVREVSEQTTPETTSLATSTAVLCPPMAEEEEWRGLDQSIRYQKDFEISNHARIRQISSQLLGSELYWNSDHFGRVLITYFIIQMPSGVAPYFFYTPYGLLKAFKPIPEELKDKTLEFQYLDRNGDIRDIHNLIWVESKVRWKHVHTLDPAWKSFLNYEVSNFGQIRSDKRGIFKERSQSYVYDRVLFRNPTHKKAVFNHRAVAFAFCFDPRPHFPNLKFQAIDHVDGKKRKNHYLNLEITTASGNTSRSGLKGKKHNLGYAIPLLRTLNEAKIGKGFPIVSAKSVTAYRVFSDIMFTLEEVKQIFPSVVDLDTLKKYLKMKTVLSDGLKLYSAPFLWDFQTEEKRFHTGVVHPPKSDVNFKINREGSLIVNQYLTKGSKSLYGYFGVTLKGTRYAVHTLMGHNFMADKWKPGLEILHGTQGSSINHWSNLKWGTSSKNKEESWSERRKKGSVENRRIIMSDKETDEELGIYDYAAQITKEFGISGTKIAQCLSGKRQSYNGYTFRYEEKDHEALGI